MRANVRKLSEKQRIILAFIRDFVQEYGYPPAIREIQLGCHFSSTSVVDYNLKWLERGEFIRRSKEIARGIELLGAGGERVSSVGHPSIPILGSIAAGEPLPIFPENFSLESMDTVEIPESFLPNAGQIFALRVKGLSMIDALIDDGDIVLVKQTTDADEGQMVVAWLKEERSATLKHIYRVGEWIQLRPANSQMPPVFTKATNVEIQGRVVGVIRTIP